MLPPELRGFNWGALFLSWIWALRNRVYIGLLALIPIPLFGLIVSIHLGMKGNELAWKRKRWEGIESFRKTQKRWAVAGSILAAIAFVVAFTAVAVSNDDARTPGPRTFVEAEGKPKTIKADDKSVQLSVPSDWAEDPTLHRDASLQVSSRSSELYAIVFVEPKDELAPAATLPKLASLAHSEVMGSLQNGQIRSQVTKKIGDRPAIVAEISGNAEGAEITYVIAVIETPTRFVQVMAWTLTDGYEARRSTLLKTIDSLRELPDVVAA
jgi:hypothetical protein